MNLKKVTVQTENNLTVTITRINGQMEAKIRKKNSQPYDLITYRAPLAHLYLVTFSFCRTRIQVLCFDYAVLNVVRMLTTDGPEDALNPCEGFIINGNVVPNTLKNENLLKNLKTSITQKLSPNLTALLTNPSEHIE